MDVGGVVYPIRVFIEDGEVEESVFFGNWCSLVHTNDGGGRRGSYAKVVSSY